MKEAKSRTWSNFDDLAHNVEMRTEVPRKKGETETDYFERLRRDYGCRSRSWLRRLDKAMKAVGETDDIQLLYKKFKEMQHEEDEKRSQKKEPEVELVYDPSIAEEYRREQEAKKAEKQIQGQMRMQMDDPPQELIDRTKFMRFEAGQYDQTRHAIADSAKMLRQGMTESMIQNELLKKATEKAAEDIAKAIRDSAVMLNTKLDRLNDTLCMILRAVRKE